MVKILVIAIESLFHLENIMKIETTYLIRQDIWMCHILPTIRCYSERENHYFEIYFAWLFWRVTFSTK